jgi:hypothetical protein
MIVGGWCKIARRLRLDRTDIGGLVEQQAEAGTVTSKDGTEEKWK